MTLLIAILALVLGLVLLVAGAEVMVRGASALATLVGLSPLVIGLTVVSYGTSAPELVVSLQSQFLNQSDLALGNVIGSNLFNILMILGLSAIITPLTVAQQLIRLDVPIMIGVCALTLLFGMDGQISQVDGIILVTGIIVYTGFLIYKGRKEPAAVLDPLPPNDARIRRNPLTALISVGQVIVGIALLVAGGNFLVSGAVTIAEALGMSQLVIGLTVVAAGTSMPELATSVVASLRGERDIAVGNVVGSNIFNVLAVLGSTAAVGGVPVAPGTLGFDVPVMIAAAIACFPIFYTGNEISRWEGLLFVAYYFAYTAYLVLHAVDYAQLGLYSNVMLLFVLPLTFITLGTLLWQAHRHKRASRPNSDPHS